MSDASAMCVGFWSLSDREVTHIRRPAALADRNAVVAIAWLRSRDRR